MNNKHITKQIKDLERKVSRLKPASSPGVATSQTTAGVYRRSLSNRKAAINSVPSSIPVWL